MILAFDTSGPHVAVCLLDGERVLTRAEEMARGQAERLMPLLEELLAEGGATWADLTRIGVGIGPGNFTGIRISVSAARGLALGLGIPAVGVSLFQTTLHLSNCAQVAVPAPRDQVYLMDHDTVREPCLAPTLPNAAFALSTEHAVTAHVETMARLAARAPVNGARPAPLYIRPADAAPSRDAPPVILS